MEGRPYHVHQAQGTYDPITNQWLNAPAGTVAQTAMERSRQDERDWTSNKTGTLHKDLMHVLLFLSSPAFCCDCDRHLDCQGS